MQFVSILPVGRGKEGSERCFECVGGMFINRFHLSVINGCLSLPVECSHYSSTAFSKFVVRSWMVPNGTWGGLERVLIALILLIAGLSVVFHTPLICVFAASPADSSDDFISFAGSMLR